MKLPLALVLVFAGASAQAQELAVTAGYPVPVGHTFLSQYDGVASGSVSFGYPVGAGVLVRLGLQYDRVHFTASGVDADVYTPRLGAARPVRLFGPLSVVPEVGASLTRVRFSQDELRPGFAQSPDAQKDGLGLWAGVAPHYDLGGGWGVGLPVEYRATFLEVPGEPAANVRYNREYRAVTVSVEGAYRF